MQTFGQSSAPAARTSIHSFDKEIVIAIWDDYTYYHIDDRGNTTIGTMTARMIHVLQSLLGNTSPLHNAVLSRDK